MLRASYEAAVARDDPSRPSLGVPFWWWVQLLVRSEEGMGSFWGRMERSLEGHGEGGFCGVFVCVRASMASAGLEIRAFNLGSRRRAKAGGFVSGARAEQAGLKYSSSGAQGPAGSNPESTC